MRAAWWLILAVQAEPKKDYTALLIGATITIGIFLLANLIAALLAWGSTSEKIKGMERAISNIPSKGDVRAEISAMHIELMKYVDERSKPTETKVLAAIAELNDKLRNDRRG